MLGAWGAIGGRGRRIRSAGRRRPDRGWPGGGRSSGWSCRSGWPWCWPRAGSTRAGGRRDRRPGPAAAAPVPQQGLRPGERRRAAALRRALRLAVPGHPPAAGRARGRPARRRSAPAADGRHADAARPGGRRRSADRWGTRVPMAAGVALVAAGAAGLAAVATPGVAYAALAPPLVLMGAGSGLFFAPFTAAVLGAAAPHEQGSASGVATTVREARRRARRRAARRGPRRPRRSRLGHADRRGRRRGAAGRRRGRRAGVLVALALPARPPTSRGDTTMTTALVRPAGPADHAAIRALLELRLQPLRRRARPRRVGAYRADLLDLDRHARHGDAARRRRRRRDRRLRGVLPRRHRPGPGLARRVGERPRDWPCTRATAATASPVHCCGSWSSAPASPVPRSSPSTPPGSWRTARALYERMGYERAPGSTAR